MGAFGASAYGEEPFGGETSTAPPAPLPPFPQLLIEEAFATAPLAETPVWVDLGAESVRDFTVTQNGRSSELDSPSAGSASFVVDVAEDRALDPTNPSSPHAPNVTPNRRVRFSIIVDGVTYPIYEGFANSHNIRYAIDRYDEAFCDLDTSDAFKILNRAPLAGMPSRPKERADIRVTAILDWVGWPTSRRSISTARTILSAEDIANRNALTALLQIDDTECGRTRIDQSGRFVFLSRRDAAALERYATSQATFSDSDVEGTIPYEAITFENSETMLRNIVQISHPTAEPIVVEDAASRLEHGPVDYRREVRDVTTPARRATAEHFLAAFKDPITRVLGLRVRTSDTPPGFPAGLFAKIASLQVGDRVTVERLRPPGAGTTVTELVAETHGQSEPFIQECFIESKSDNARQGELTWFTSFGLSHAPPVDLLSKWGSGKWGTAKWGW